MKAFLLFISLIILSRVHGLSQNSPCGTDEFEKTARKNPSIDKKVREYEKAFNNNVRESVRGVNIGSQVEGIKIFNQKRKDSLSLFSLCGYDNTYKVTGAAPAIIGNTLTANNIYGGDFMRVTNMIAGRAYRISVCGNATWDTQITIYTAGGGTAVAHNDDYCSSQSEIYFTPSGTGNYDILLDEYNCGGTFFVSANLVVELVYVPAPIVTIPVVVHVVWNTSAENISDLQVQSQINVLNQDFRRLNSDISNAPAAFRGWSSDALYQFCLAQQDPNGLPTNGITRTNTNITQFDLPNDTSIWFTALGGKNSWDRNRYLNIWVCDLPGLPSPGVIGIGFFPWLGAVFPDFDGVVSDYQAFGTFGTATAPVNLGRNSTHEVGHYLGLRHIWGDESACAGSDSVPDTPNQTVRSSGVPSFPLTDACSQNYPGVMFNNYMDYSDDAIKNMFTYFQTSRTDAAIRNGGIRASLATSNGCVPSTVGMNQLVLSNIVSVFPNPSKGIFQLAGHDELQNFKIMVTDIVGEKVLETKTSTSKTEIDLSNQPNGVYFLHVSSEKGSLAKKIIINK